MIASVTITNSKASIIADAIRSVVDHVDKVVIIDTGVTDDTHKRIAEVASKKLYTTTRPWIDFGTARNESLKVAAELGAEWAVVVDSDERFDFRGVSLRDELKKASADILWLAAADGTYVKEKILRLGKQVHYHGPTHEVPVGGSYAMFPTAVFDELPKSSEQLLEKHRRDINVLSLWLERPENANDGRWYYYLGDAYHGIGDTIKAIGAFSRCVDLRQPVSEEGAWAAFRQAQCLAILNRHVEAIEVCARGFSRHAGVGELAWLAAVSCHRLGWHEQAVCWANTAVALGRYAGRSPPRLGFTYLPALFELPYDVLRFTLPTDEEKRQATAAFAAAKRARLGVTDDYNLDVGSVSLGSRRQELRAMLRPSSLRKMLKTTRVIDLEPTPESLKKGEIGNYHAMNPSVCVYSGDLWVLIRMVNYTIENGAYVSPDPDGKIRTENILYRMRIQKTGGLLSTGCLVRDLDNSPRYPTAVLGYEDMRLFSVNGKLCASATVRDQGEDRCKISFLELDEDSDVIRAEVQVTNRWTEKNWMPIEGNGVAWLYEVCPTSVRMQGGSVSTKPCSLALEHLCGGSQVIPFADGWICVTHETISQDGWGCRRIYLHRFVRFDKEFQVTAVSPAWIFEDGHHGIEFCAGLCRDPHKQGQLILGYGVEDRQAKLLLVQEDEIERLAWIHAPKK
jgi:tetratricopeptide (TPR) repeat protein